MATWQGAIGERSVCVEVDAFWRAHFTILYDMWSPKESCLTLVQNQQLPTWSNLAKVKCGKVWLATKQESSVGAQAPPIY